MDYTNNYDQQDIVSNKGMCVLAYLGLLWLIPFFLRKESPYTQFHLNQGLILLVAELIVSVAATVIKAAFGLIGLDLIVTLVDLASDFLQVIIFVFMILGIVNVIGFRAKELPFIGSIRIIK